MKPCSVAMLAPSGAVGRGCTIRTAAVPRTLLAVRAVLLSQPGPCLRTAAPLLRRAIDRQSSPDAKVRLLRSPFRGREDVDPWRFQSQRAKCARNFPSSAQSAPAADFLRSPATSSGGISVAWTRPVNPSSPVSVRCSRTDMLVSRHRCRTTLTPCRRKGSKCSAQRRRWPVVSRFVSLAPDRVRFGMGSWRGFSGARSAALCQRTLSGAWVAEGPAGRRANLSAILADRHSE